MRWLGKFASILGAICYVVFGILGFLVSLYIVHESTGFFGFVVAFALFPITFIAAPWYALYHWGTWIPVLINYGGMITAGVLRTIGEALDPT